MAPLRIASRLKALAERRRKLEARLAEAARAHLPESGAQRFLSELPHLLRDMEPLRKRAALALAEGPRATSVPPPGPGWPWDVAAMLLRLQQGHPWKEAERATYAELGRREKHRARKVVERMLMPRGPTARRSDPEKLRSSRAHARQQRWVVERVAFLIKELSGKFPGYTRDWDDGGLGGSGVRLVKAALDWALSPLPVVGEERIVRWLRELRRDGKAHSLPPLRTYALPAAVVLDGLDETEHA